MVTVKTKEYITLKGNKENLIEKVADGSIIVRFDKTKIPKENYDVVCPHFLELKWAYGCPYSCSWCYLQGTYRWPQFKKHGSNISPKIKDKEKIRKHIEVISKNGESNILNSGELADSLMMGAWLPKFLKDLDIGENKVLFLSKGDDVQYLLNNKDDLRNKIIMSFTLNASKVSETWEKNAPRVDRRIIAAKKVSNVGYKTRVRIDPIVPIDDWKIHYKELIDSIFKEFIPDRITIGSLRGLQSTINAASDKSWVSYFGEKSNWGKKIPNKIRFEMYALVIDYLKNSYGFDKIALCKETVEIWEMLGLDYKEIRCNCIF